MNYNDFDMLINGIEDGKLDVVKRHFQKEFLNKIDTRSDNNSQPIHVASKKGVLEIVEYLIKKGCDIEAETTNGKRAIHFAAMEGHVHILRLLISNSCNFESETINGERPIHYAAMKGHLEVLRTLIGLNCQLQPRNRDGKTPLALATMCEDNECIKLLEEVIEGRRIKQLTNDPEAVNKISLKDLIAHNFLTKIMDSQNGKTLLDFVLETNDSELLEAVKTKPIQDGELKDLLSLKGNQNPISPQSYTLLEECLLYRALRIFNQTTIHELCTPDVANRTTLFMGPTVLEITAEYQFEECARFVMERLIKADESWERAMTIAKRVSCPKLSDLILTREKYLKLQEKDGYSRLHIAVYDNSPDMISYLVKNNIVSVDEGDKRMGTAISIAFVSKYVDCIKTLEQCNASADTYNRYKQTPLHVAIANGMYQFCDYLISKMTDLETKDAYGFTVLDRARKRGFKELCEKLISKGAIYNDDPRIEEEEEYSLPRY